MDALMIPLLFILIVIGATLEIISLFRNTGNVDFDYSISSGVSEPNKPIEIVTTITNKSLLPISHLLIKEKFPITATLPADLTHYTLFDGIYIKRICRIKSRSRKKIVFETSINKRGVFSFKAESMEIGDFLGFKELKKDISTYKHIVIYPERYESTDFIDALSNFQGDIVAKRYLIRDPILTVGLRDYTGREPMREIHWPKSAHQGKLMVREFDYNRQLSVNVLLNVTDIGYKQEDKDDLDKCCAIVRTICETLVTQDVPVSFFTNASLVGKTGQDIWKCEVSSNNTQGLLETLGRVINHTRNSLEQLLEHTCRASDPTSVSILISPKSTKNIDETIDEFIRITGREIILLKADRFSLNMTKEVEVA